MPSPIVANVADPVAPADVASQFAPGQDAAPIPWYSAVGRSFDNAQANQTLGGRTQLLEEALDNRNADIVQRVGAGPAADLLNTRNLERDASATMGAPFSSALFGDALDPIASFTHGAGEAEIDALRQKYPAQMAGVPRGVDIQASVDARLKAIAAAADIGAQQHPVASFIGGAGASLTDPVTMGVGIASGGVGEELPFALRALTQSGVWGGLAALEAPAKAAEARTVGGPAYGLPEALGDVGGGLAMGPIFETLGALGGAALKPLLRGLAKDGAEPITRALAGDDAARGALDVLNQGVRDAQAVGPLRAGADYEAGVSSLAAGDAPPPIAQNQDLGDLFGGQVAPAEPAVLASTPQLPGSSNGAALFEQAEYRGRSIYAGSFDPRQLATDPATFQYKAGGDAAGVTDRLKGVQAWDPTSSGKVIVYQPDGGALTIADGHQRLGLANRLDAAGFEPRLDGYLFRQRDGWTAQDVRTIAALKNIREGQGAPLDAAKVFRDQPQAMVDDSLPVSGGFIAEAKGLAKLSPEAFGAVVNKVIPERYAAKIGELAGMRPDLHAGLVRLLHAGEPANMDEAHSLIHEALVDDWVKNEGSEADLFGDTPAQSLAIARSKLRASLLRSLRSDGRLYGQLTRHADAIEAGGNVLARDANEASLATTNAAFEQISKLGMRAGEVGDAMTAGARKIEAGARAGDAAKPILARIKRALAAGERLDEGRAALLDPAEPLPGAESHAEAFSEVGGKGQEGQLAPKPEEAHLEAVPVDHMEPSALEHVEPAGQLPPGERPEGVHPSLFEDILKETPPETAALEHLKGCAPA